MHSNDAIFSYNKAELTVLVIKDIGTIIDAIYTYFMNPNRGHP